MKHCAMAVQDILQENLENRLLPLFANRVLSFDMACTQAYANILSRSRRSGMAIETADAFIAAIARTHKLTVATRDTSPFEAVGVNIINPWKALP